MIDSAFRVAAQGKINLGLRVLAREVGGYHQLETVFARLDLADELVVTIGGAGRSLDVQGADTGPVEGNLAWRAAHLFAELVGWPAAFRLELTKRIPVGGGLGGGSADAAAVLRALNAAAPAPASQAALLRMAFHLGADVPFLTTEFALALAWGRGERLLRLPTIDSRPVVLLVPPFGVATAEAFAWLAADRERDGAGGAEPALIAPAGNIDWRALEALAGNDLEAPVRRRHQQLGAVLDALRAALPDRWIDMTGSGSTLFALDASREVATSLPEDWGVLETTAPAAARPIERLE